MTNFQIKYTIACQKLPEKLIWKSKLQKLHRHLCVRRRMSSWKNKIQVLFCLHNKEINTTEFEHVF